MSTRSTGTAFWPASSSRSCSRAATPELAPARPTWGSASSCARWPWHWSSRLTCSSTKEWSELTDLTGRVALVTGGSRGLGREMVTAYAAHGADVVIASRKLDSCEALAAEISEKYGVRAVPVSCNVSDWADCDALVERAYAEFGRVDILVNNAGLSPLYPSLEEVSEALWDKVIGVNLKGPFRLSAAIGARMVAAGGGCILNISSIASLRPDAISL